MPKFKTPTIIRVMPKAIDPVHQEKAIKTKLAPSVPQKNVEIAREVVESVLVTPDEAVSALMTPPVGDTTPGYDPNDDSFAPVSLTAPKFTPKLTPEEMVELAAMQEAEKAAANLPKVVVTQKADLVVATPVSGPLGVAKTPMIPAIIHNNAPLGVPKIPVEQEVPQEPVIVNEKPPHIPFQSENLHFPKTWVGKRLQICTPFYKTTNPATAVCLAATLAQYGLEKVGWIWKLGDAMIYHSRNKIADEFIKTGAEWSFWCDDDMVFPLGAGRAGILREFCSLPDNFPAPYLEVNTIETLLSRKKSLVGAFYTSRNPKGIPQNREGVVSQVRAATKVPGQMQGCHKTGWVGSGLMLVHRNVFLDIRKRFPELAPGPKFTQDNFSYTTDYWDYFGPLPGRGEDVAFCTRAAEAGHSPHVDYDVRPFHVGYACYNFHNTLA